MSVRTAQPVTPPAVIPAEAGIHTALTEDERTVAGTGDEIRCTTAGTGSLTVADFRGNDAGVVIPAAFSLRGSGENPLALTEHGCGRLRPEGSETARTESCDSPDTTNVGSRDRAYSPQAGNTWVFSISLIAWRFASTSRPSKKRMFSSRSP